MVVEVGLHGRHVLVDSIRLSLREEGDDGRLGKGFVHRQIQASREGNQPRQAFHVPLRGRHGPPFWISVHQDHACHLHDPIKGKAQANETLGVQIGAEVPHLVDRLGIEEPSLLFCLHMHEETVRAIESLGHHVEALRPGMGGPDIGRPGDIVAHLELPDAHEACHEYQGEKKGDSHPTAPSGEACQAFCKGLEHASCTFPLRPGGSGQQGHQDRTDQHHDDKGPNGPEQAEPAQLPNHGNAGGEHGQTHQTGDDHRGRDRRTSIGRNDRLQLALRFGVPPVVLLHGHGTANERQDPQKQREDKGHGIQCNLACTQEPEAPEHGESEGEDRHQGSAEAFEIAGKEPEHDEHHGARSNRDLLPGHRCQLGRKKSVPGEVENVVLILFLRLQGVYKPEEALMKLIDPPLLVLFHRKGGTFFVDPLFVQGLCLQVEVCDARHDHSRRAVVRDDVANT